MGNDLTKIIDHKTINTNQEKYFADITNHLINNININNLLNLRETKYCDELIIITARILEEHFINNNINVFNNKSYFNKYNIQKAYFIDKSKYNKIDKMKICIGIAEYYIKIIKLYSVIITSINPIYYVNTFTGEKKVEKVPLNNIYKYKREDIEEIKTDNICSNMIDILLKSITVNKKNIEVTNRFCNIKETYYQLKKNLDKLDKLYYDIYNHKTGKFDDMSDYMKNKYNKDLKILYMLFTTNELDIENKKMKFSDIPVQFDYFEACNKRQIIPYSGKYKTLITKYRENIKKLVEKTRKHNKKLLDILKKVFHIKNNKLIIKDINSKNIDKIFIEVITIIKLKYNDCVTNYKVGISIFEDIISIMELQNFKIIKPKLETQKGTNYLFEFSKNHESQNPELRNYTNDLFKESQNPELRNYTNDLFKESQNPELRNYTNDLFKKSQNPELRNYTNDLFKESQNPELRNYTNDLFKESQNYNSSKYYESYKNMLYILKNSDYNKIPSVTDNIIELYFKIISIVNILKKDKRENNNEIQKYYTLKEMISKDLIYKINKSTKIIFQIKQNNQLTNTHKKYIKNIIYYYNYLKNKTINKLKKNFLDISFEDKKHYKEKINNIQTKIDELILYL
jgi:hypothetical protein